VRINWFFHKAPFPLWATKAWIAPLTSLESPQESVTWTRYQPQVEQSAGVMV
jgi:hypothetical protein